jgi:hypothetical protein
MSVIIVCHQTKITMQHFHLKNLNFMLAVLYGTNYKLIDHER